ncbi:hypothetical protein, partial [Streptomyces sp. BF23-19]|uniref:hypothetical protein n=1 Tax=Streptomyces sp. BF23-19 TaxID=3240283 RepID=UPI0034E4490B
IIFSSELATAGLAAESTAAAQAAADVLRGFNPLAQALLAHRGVLAQALHVLTRRHIVDGRIDQAGAVARETIQAYQELAATADADVDAVGNNLIIFSSELATAGLAAESTAAAQAAADVQN